jgi:hypothetical protein
VESFLSALVDLYSKIQSIKETEKMLPNSYMKRLDAYQIVAMLTPEYH